VDRTGNVAIADTPEPVPLDATETQGVIIGVEPAADNEALAPLEKSRRDVEWSFDGRERINPYTRAS
jgi:hypothetical protein